MKSSNTGFFPVEEGAGNVAARGGRARATSGSFEEGRE
jgi:hypothetical protein